MIPDWRLYIPFGPGYSVTHSFPGIVIACVPLGLVVVWTYLYVLRMPLYDLLPSGFRLRLLPAPTNPALSDIPAQLKIALAIGIGSLTHQVWDAFTHGNGWGVAMVPALKQVWTSVAGVKLLGYQVLQHGSSLIGLPLLTLIVALWYRKSTPQPADSTLLPRHWRWLCQFVIVATPLGFIVYHWSHADGTGFHDIGHALYYGATDGGTAFLLLLLTYSLILYPIMSRPD